jgi:multiple sugar transport system substrate-binding protein
MNELFLNATLSRKNFLRSVAAISLAAYCGCENPAREKTDSTTAATKSAAPSLKLLVIDDPELGQFIAREWRARTENELQLQTATAAEIAGARRLPADVVVFATGLLGELAEHGLIVPLDETQLADEAFDRHDIFEHVRRNEMNWGNKTFATPLGSPQLLLVYRADIFASLKVQPPQTWDEYQAIVERLANRGELGELAPAAGSPWQATCEPLAAGWAGQLLLARAAAYAAHRDQISHLFAFDDLEPLISQPPFVRALAELVAANGEQGSTLTPMEAYESLIAGRSAMALAWLPNGIATPPKKESTTVAIECGQLPGSRDVFNFGTQQWEVLSETEDPHASLIAVAGRLGAVTIGASQQRQSQDFLQWLSGSEMSARISPYSSATTLFRLSQIPAARRWLSANVSPQSAASYAEALRAAQSQPRWIWSLRLPGRAEYLAALDEAVHAALQGESPQTSLAKAAEKWQSITNRLGLASQRQANERCLGLATARM